MITSSTYTLQALTSRFLELCLEATVVICTKQAAAETFDAALSSKIEAASRLRQAKVRSRQSSARLTKKSLGSAAPS